MTLIIVAASPRGAYLGSDYRLTSSKWSETNQGVKQLAFCLPLAGDKKFMGGQLAFTGSVVKQGNVGVREHLSRAFENLKRDCYPNEVTRGVLAALDSYIGKIAHPDKRLTVAMISTISDKERPLHFFQVFSNFETPRGEPLSRTGTSSFTVHDVSIARGCVRVYGSHILVNPDGSEESIVSRPERRLLEVILADPKADSEKLASRLAEIMQNAARHLAAKSKGVPTVSETCMVSWTHSSGMHSKNFGDTQGGQDFIIAGLNLRKWMHQWARENLQTADGQKIEFQSLTEGSSFPKARKPE